jgi:hypothetical protein
MVWQGKDNTMLYFWIVPLILLIIAAIGFSFVKRSRKIPDGESRLDEARRQ